MLINKLKKKKGVTLIEVLVVVAIINILFFVATPVYEQYIDDAHADAVKNQMFDISTDMERIRARFFSYESAIDNSGDFIVSPELLIYPENVNESTRFTLAVTNVTASSYTIIATPTSNQGSDYGRIKLEQDGLSLEGHHDVYNDSTWMEKWY